MADEENGHELLPAVSQGAGELVCSDLPIVKRALGDIKAIGKRLEAEKLYHEAGQLYDDKRYQDAVDKSLAALQVAADFSGARALAGVCFAYLGRRGQAEEYVARAEQEAPLDMEVCYRAGSAYEELGAIDQAEARFRRCLELDPRYFKAECRLATISLRAGRRRDARIHTDRLLELNPNCPCGYTRRALCELEGPGGDRGRLKEAIDSGLELNPFQSVLHRLREMVRPGDAHPMAKCIEESGLDHRRPSGTRRITYLIRDGDFAQALSEALLLDVPEPPRVLRADLQASLALRLMPGAENDGARESLAAQARGHLESAESLLPEYWLTERIRSRLRGLEAERRP